VALVSSYAGAIAIPQDRVAPIFALMAGTIVTGMGSASAEEKCLAVMGAIAIVSLATGAFLFALGWLRLGNLIRYIPLSGDRRVSCRLGLAIGSRRPACDDGSRSEF
jgi:SulP family sulfate permease